ATARSVATDRIARFMEPSLGELAACRVGADGRGAEWAPRSYVRRPEVSTAGARRRAAALTASRAMTYTEGSKEESNHERRDPGRPAAVPDPERGRAGRRLPAARGPRAGQTERGDRGRALRAHAHARSCQPLLDLRHLGAPATVRSAGGRDQRLEVRAGPRRVLARGQQPHVAVHPPEERRLPR